VEDGKKRGAVLVDKNITVGINTAYIARLHRVSIYNARNDHPKN